GGADRRGAGAHLQLRVLLLCGLRRAAPGHLPQLRRRAGPPADPATAPRGLTASTSSSAAAPRAATAAARESTPAGAPPPATARASAPRSSFPPPPSAPGASGRPSDPAGSGRRR